ncbi:MAG: hypothetical protein ACMUHB_01225 [Thermoplasmatota archaeon]
MDDDFREDRIRRKKGESPTVLKGAVVLAIVVAVLLMFIGGIFMFLQSPLNTAANDQGDRETSAWLDFAGRLIFWLGASIMSTILIIGAILMGNLDPAVRFGMLFLAGLMLIGTGLAI